MKLKEFVSHEIPVAQVHIQTEQEAEALGRQCGQYITLETGPLDKLNSYQNACACLADQLRPLLMPFFGKTLCVCGIGNCESLPDSLGPETAKRFRPEMCNALSMKSNFDSIAVICPGTHALTNLTSDTIISGVASRIGAACVLAVDSCVCKEAERLCRAIYVTDSGLQTYWGVSKLCQSTLGLPVISIAVPVVIRAPDLSVKTNIDPDCLFTTHNIMDVIKSASFVIACAVMQVAYPELGYEECKQCIEFSLLGVI